MEVPILHVEKPIGRDTMTDILTKKYVDIAISRQYYDTHKNSSFAVLISPSRRLFYDINGTRKFMTNINDRRGFEMNGKIQC